MPIDPNIALSVRPQPVPNIAETYGNMLQLKNLANRNQIEQQQIQAGQQEQQLRQQQIQDQQTVMQEMAKNPDPKVYLPALRGKVSPATYNAMIKADAETREQLAKTDQAELALLKDKNDRFMGLLNQAKALPPDQYAQQWPAILQTAEEIHPGTAQKFGLNPQTPVPQQNLDAFGIGLQTQEQYIKQAQEDAAAKKRPFEQREVEAKAQTAESEASIKGAEADAIKGGALPPNLAEMKYQSILQKLSARQPVSPVDVSWAKAYEASKAKSSITSDSLGVTSTNTSRPQGLAAVGAGGAPRAAGGGAPQAGSNSPQSLKDSLVDMIGQYKYNPALFSRLVTKHPDVLAMVNQKYPDFRQSDYNAINKAVTDLAPSGKTGQQITSYNTFLRHAGALYDAVETLDNSKYSDLLNKPLNWLAQHTGDPRVADFMAAMQPPMKEFQSFLLNNHAMHTEDVKDAHDLIDQNKTPQEIKAVLKRFAETGSARLSEQNESFKRVTGRDIPNLVSPEAAKAYNKITQSGGGMIRVQIPGHPPGQIPASAKDKFLKDNPTATILQ